MPLLGQSEFLVVADAVLGARKAVRYSATAGRVELALADGSRKRVVGFTAYAAAAAGDEVVIRSNDVMGGFAGLTPGAAYYLSQATAGEIIATKPATGEVQLVGVAKSATELDVEFDFSDPDFSASAPTTIQPDDAAAAGTSASAARLDHKHAIVAAAPVSIGTANAEGTSTSFARADHAHDHGAQTAGTLHAAATTSVAGFMAATDKTKLDGVQYKAGIANSFTGNPKKATITFSAAFADTSYVINIVGVDVRSWTYEGKTAGGFTINSNSNTALLGEVSWECTKVGEVG